MTLVGLANPNVRDWNPILLQYHGLIPSSCEA
jgi:hypothetical protein